MMSPVMLVGGGGMYCGLIDVSPVGCLWYGVTIGTWVTAFSFGG